MTKEVALTVASLGMFFAMAGHAGALEPGEIKTGMIRINSSQRVAKGSEQRAFPPDDWRFKYYGGRWWYLDNQCRLGAGP